MIPLPYLALRLVRRALPTTLPAWLRGSVMRRNLGAKDGTSVLRLYEKYLGDRRPGWPAGATVLEAGVGATNGSCYSLAARGASRALALEPFVPLDAALDAAQLRDVAARLAAEPGALRAKIERLLSTASLAAGSVDTILSNSVLEHVRDFDAFAAELARLLRPGGFMLHVVDYRDHCFRYPYHFLLWSRAMWERWLDPGDLPRWRISDHVAAFERCGLRVSVLMAKPVPGEFERIRARVHPEFSHYDEAALSTAYGVLFITRP